MDEQPPLAQICTSGQAGQTTWNWRRRTWHTERSWFTSQKDELFYILGGKDPTLPLLSRFVNPATCEAAHPECFGTSLICSDAGSLYLVHGCCEQAELKAFINDNAKWDHCIVWPSSLLFRVTPRTKLWCQGTVQSWNESWLSFIHLIQFSVASFSLFSVCHCFTFTPA